MQHIWGKFIYFLNFFIAMTKFCRIFAHIIIKLFNYAGKTNSSKPQN